MALMMLWTVVKSVPAFGGGKCTEPASSSHRTRMSLHHLRRNETMPSPCDFLNNQLAPSDALLNQPLVPLDPVQDGRLSGC